LEEGVQKPPQPAPEAGAVVAGGGAAGVGAVTLAALEVIAVHSGRGFQTADRLDEGAALHLAADGRVTRRTWPVIQTRDLWA